MQVSADAKIWNKSDPDSNLDLRINLDPDARQIVDTLVDVIHFAKFGSNRLLIVWELRKKRNANKCQKIAYSSVVKKIKTRNPRADPDHHQKSTTSRGSPLASAKFGRRPFPHSSVILFTDWQNEWKNDRERSHNIRLIDA